MNALQADASPCKSLFEHVWEPSEAVVRQGEADQAGGEAVEAEVAAPGELVVVQVQGGEPDTETQNLHMLTYANTEKHDADIDICSHVLMQRKTYIEEHNSDKC